MSQEIAQPLVTLLIATKNRIDCVQRLVNSLRQQDYQNREVIVFDDGSDPPVPDLGSDVNLIRNCDSKGACFARNRGLEIAKGDFIIIFDDDTELVDSQLISRAVTLAKAHPESGAIAFHQLRPDGQSHGIQPAKADYLSYIVTPAFYGCLVRKKALTEVGSHFIEEFNYYYEEVEFALRLLDAGYKVIYDPNLSVVHYVDLRERDWKRIYRLYARNAMLTAFLRYPWWNIFPSLIATSHNFLRLTAVKDRADFIGLIWIFGSLINLLPFALANRKTVTIQTLKLFKQLRNLPMSVESPPSN